MSLRILIACVGNIFLGDDAFGVEVARALRGRRFPDTVQVMDFGIRAFDLAYALPGSLGRSHPGGCGSARRRARHALHDRTRPEWYCDGGG